MFWQAARLRQIGISFQGTTIQECNRNGYGDQNIVAHNVNERMQQNQYGRCAMMAMCCFSAEVIKTGVDPYGLGRWCWLRVGSGDKKPEESWLTNPWAQN
jgi:hypothetical protein